MIALETPQPQWKLWKCDNCQIKVGTWEKSQKCPCCERPMRTKISCENCGSYNVGVTFAIKDIVVLCDQCGLFDCRAMYDEDMAQA